jgi:hypothetical protein
VTPCADAAAQVTDQFNITVTTTTTNVIPAANNVAANWQMAGMQVVGGIPNRTTICATVNPIGGGTSDSANINTAIADCPGGAGGATRSRDLQHLFHRRQDEQGHYVAGDRNLQ